MKTTTTPTKHTYKVMFDQGSGRHWPATTFACTYKEVAGKAAHYAAAKRIPYNRIWVKEIV